MGTPVEDAQGGRRGAHELPAGVVLGSGAARS
jgi:hypothetical protein